KKLNKKHGVYQVVIEEDWVHNEIANQYILSDHVLELPPSLIDRRDILETIRLMNMHNKIIKPKFEVLLVDVTFGVSDYQFIKNQYQCYKKIFHQLFPELTLELTFKKFAELDHNNRLNLFNQLYQSASDCIIQQNIFNLIQSEKFMQFVKLDDYKNQRMVREQIISQNIKYFSNKYSNKSFLIYYGDSHGMKVRQKLKEKNGIEFEFTPFVVELMKSGYRVHTLSCIPVLGDAIWSYGRYNYTGVRLIGLEHNISMINETIKNLNDDEYLYLPTNIFDADLEYSQKYASIFHPLTDFPYERQSLEHEIENRRDAIIFLKKVSPNWPWKVNSD
ncbi:MAG: hypothetical protein MJB14_02545, partial [Spirochaetes bacterium]|nr:hypothetical protein [Spirochaetota bacterium]